MKTTKSQPQAVITLSNGVQFKFEFTDPIYTEKYANELRASGTILGSWIKDIKVLDSKDKIS
jgi:hypothetical protein